MGSVGSRSSEPGSQRASSRKLSRRYPTRRSRAACSFSALKGSCDASRPKRSASRKSASTSAARVAAGSSVVVGGDSVVGGGSVGCDRGRGGVGDEHGGRGGRGVVARARGEGARRRPRSSTAPTRSPRVSSPNRSRCPPRPPVGAEPHGAEGSGDRSGETGVLRIRRRAGAGGGRAVDAVVVCPASPQHHEPEGHEQREETEERPHHARGEHDVVPTVTRGSDGHALGRTDTTAGR